MNTQLELYNYFDNFRMEKFRDVPGLENLVAREEANKKKEMALSELEESLRKR